MEFDAWGFDTVKTFEFPLSIGGTLLVLVYLLLLARLFQINRREWRQLTPGRWVGLVTALVIGSLAGGLLLVELPGPTVLPLPNLPDTPAAPAAPLLGSLALLLVAGTMGTGPAMLVGVGCGLARATWLTGRGLQVLEVALLAALAAFLLRQHYLGRGFGWLRRPIIAGPIVGLAAGLLVFPSAMTMAGPGTSLLVATDFAWSVTRAAILPSLVEWAAAGLAVELIYARLPALRPRSRLLIPPPYAHSLTRRFLYILIPTFVLTAAGLVVVVTNVAVNSATELALAQMSHDARVASAAIPDIELVSSNLLAAFASPEGLVLAGQDEQQATMAQIMNLERLLRTTAYFRQLVLFDQAGAVLRAYPSLEEEGGLQITGEEQTFAIRAAQDGHPGTTQVLISELGVPILSHVEPIRNEQGESVGALLGRVDLGVALQPIVEGLQGTVGSGRGFIVDSQSTIIAYAEGERLLTQPWSPTSEQVINLDARLGGEDQGHAYQGIGPNGARQLVYYLSGPGHPWTLVIRVPHERVLSLATQVAGPLGISLGVAAILFVVLVALLIRRLSQPLSVLVAAAGAMAHRDLETPIVVGGEDEVGRLGRAFERMRCALRDRLNELQLLLTVSQSVAANLNLPRGLPPILDGALKATSADGIRILAVLDQEQSPLVFSKGSLAQAMAGLDGAVVKLVQREMILRLDNTARARTAIDTGRYGDVIGAILAVPLRTAQGFQGVLWVAYRQPHTFSDSEVRFMVTLAGQASVLVENAQLYASAEGGRRRLAAILASTNDAVIVTDRRDRILLLNPAAEAAFGLSGSQVMGQSAADVLADPGLVGLLTGRYDDSVTREVELPDGRVLYASASVISTDDSPMSGRVAVLRDITHLKELDQMKTDFVNTVSHDLRSPLTYMRGYVTMLPMVGELSSKQKQYADKILSGIDQMTQLVEDLLNLARIESDVDWQLQPVAIGELVKMAAVNYRPRAVGKGLAYRIDVADDIPLVMGDPTLLRQAMSNLIDNAIKYCPSGEITVRAHAGQHYAILQVQDTGPGIAQADQVRLFEAFYRVKRRDSLDIKGTGLGLAIVKSIVEKRHGGRVWVESQLGAGSTFYIVLPTKTADDVEAEPGAPTDDAASGQSSERSA